MVKKEEQCLLLPLSLFSFINFGKDLYIPRRSFAKSSPPPLRRRSRVCMCDAVSGSCCVFSTADCLFTLAAAAAAGRVSSSSGTRTTSTRQCRGRGGWCAPGTSSAATSPHKLLLPPCDNNFLPSHQRAKSPGTRVVSFSWSHPPDNHISGPFIRCHRVHHPTRLQRASECDRLPQFGLL